MEALSQVLQVLMYVSVVLGGSVIAAFVLLLVVPALADKARVEQQRELMKARVKQQRELFAAQVLLILRQGRHGWKVVHRAARKDTPKLQDFVIDRPDRTTCAYVTVLEDGLSYVEGYSPVKPAADNRTYTTFRTPLPGVESFDNYWSFLAEDDVQALQSFLHSRYFWDSGLSQWTLAECTGGWKSSGLPEYVKGPSRTIASGAGPLLLQTSEGILGAGTETPLNNQQATA